MQQKTKIHGRHSRQKEVRNNLHAAKVNYLKLVHQSLALLRSLKIMHDHQQIVHTMDVQVFYYCTILIRRYVGEAWQPRPRVVACTHASQKAKARHVITSSSHIPTAVVVVSLCLWTRQAAVYRPDVRSRPRSYVCFCLLRK